MLKSFLSIMMVLTGAVGVAHAQAVAVPVSATVATPAPAAETAGTAYKAVDAKARQAVAAVTMTGDADVDFLRLVMPYQKAISDLATAALKYSTEADVRMMAGDMIKQQETDLRTVREWLVKHGPMDASASDARVETTSPTVTVPLVGKPASPKKTISMAELLNVSKTVPVSGSLPTPTLPPVDVISPTQALQTVVSATALMPDGMPAALTPDMPMPDAAIVNTAPKMEFLDGPK